MIPSDERVARALLETRNIALVGASIKPARASHSVGNYLASVGYRVIPVNPLYVGEMLFGQTVVGRLADIKEDVHLIDIFRNSSAILPVVTEAVATLKGLRIIWMQLDLRNTEARELAERQGVTVIEDRCTAIEHRRLLANPNSA